jgi:hypothetical protein
MTRKTRCPQEKTLDDMRLSFSGEKTLLTQLDYTFAYL